jgi:SnoaL-like domain
MSRTDAELTHLASHLLARYVWAIDDGAYGDLREVFTEDAYADYGPFSCRGAEELVIRMEELHRDLLTTQHLVGSVLARGEPDGSASVVSHVRATLVRTPGGRDRVEVAATYRDRMVLTPAGPRLAERHVEGHWIAGVRDILPWFREQTSPADPRSTSPDDGGV